MTSTAMTRPIAYADDLAYIHDSGFGDFAARSATGLLALLADCRIASGRVVDLGCGSGIWARKLVDAGYAVVGVDISPAMVEIARGRVPEAEFHVASLFAFPLPACAAVTALGEVFNYLFDENNSLAGLRGVCQGVFEALAAGGLLVFDIAEPGRSSGRRQSFREAADWTCLVEYEHDAVRERLTRRIVTFRKIGDTFRRHEEIHVQQLYQAAAVAAMLTDVGFQVDCVRSYGDYALAESTVGLVAHKPPSADSHVKRFALDPKT